jgi:ferritin-like metal-binding protein YciE
MEITTLRDLFEDHICDLYSVEEQILDALPDLIDAATDSDLIQALKNHQQQTMLQQSRLEEIGRMLDFSLEGKKCEGMKGILKEGSHLVEQDVDEEYVRDAAIIAAAQRVEHYEIAVYGTARTFARMLGEEGAVRLLEETLQEEKDADVLMTKIAEAHVNRRAMAGGD